MGPGGVPALFRMSRMYARRTARSLPRAAGAPPKAAHRNQHNYVIPIIKIYKFARAAAMPKFQPVKDTKTALSKRSIHRIVRV